MSTSFLSKASLTLLILWFATFLNAQCQEAKPTKDRETVLIGQVKELFTVGPREHLSSFALSPDGRFLLYGAYKKVDRAPRESEIFLIDLETGKELQRAQGPHVGGSVFSPDGKWLALGKELWDVEAWKPKMELKCPEGYKFARPLAFSPDGKLLAGRVQGKREKYQVDSVVLWDVATGDVRLLEDESAYLMGSAPRFLSHMPGSLAVIAPKELDMKTALVANRFVGCRVEAITFPDDGAPDRLFVFYEPGLFTTLWDTKKSKVLGTEWAGGGGGLEGERALLGGLPAPRTCMDLMRIRVAPGGWILMLPKYGRVPLAAVQHKDQTIALAVTPSEKKWGLVTTNGGGGHKFNELGRLEDYKGGLGTTCWLRPDGRRLVAFGIEAAARKEKDVLPTLRIWDVAALLPRAAEKLEKLTAKEELETLWAQLFQDNGEAGAEMYVFPSFMPGRPSVFMTMQALHSLYLHDEDGVAWLDKKLARFDPKAVAKWIADLDSADFKTRNQASRDLGRLGPVIRPFLAAALKKNPSPETQRRIDNLLKDLPRQAAYELRHLRIIDLLEHINTPAARELLDTYAEGRRDPAFAEEASQALKRTGAKR